MTQLLREKKMFFDRALGRHYVISMIYDAVKDRLK